MRLGIDFDNTIVRYDALFHRVALEGGWIPPNLPVNKSEVRNHLRRIGREDVWTEMQGTVYGPRLAEAAPFPGVLDFFRECRAAGVPVSIISHKTHTPFAGPPHDLHAAALAWLEKHGFFDDTDIGLRRSDVFFELTKTLKLDRIRACGCSVFIDDLPEFLAEPGFPSGTTRVLFDPGRLYGPEVPFHRLHDWSSAARFFTWDESSRLRDFAARWSKTEASSVALELLPGGANNRVYRVTRAAGAEPLALKRYYRHPGDPRDRFAAEHAFYGWIRDRRVGRAPRALAWDTTHRLGLFEFVPGRKLESGEVSESHVEQAIAFVLELNVDRHQPGAALLPTASEACFSIAEHLDRVAIRVERLARIEPVSEIDRDAVRFVGDELRPRWEAVRTLTLRGEPEPDTAALPGARRCLSPSDFGFHNAILAPDGGLRFFDFEYAGWDDPAKLVCDFFCQPRIPVPRTLWRRVIEAIGAGLGWGKGLGDRAGRLLPAYQIKWCCILLNEFLRGDRMRRAFADGTGPREDRKAVQLAKARLALARLDEVPR